MGKLDLNITISNLNYLISELKKDSQIMCEGKLSLELSVNYRNYACGCLLRDLDVECFKKSLNESAKNYLSLLENANSIQDRDMYYLCVSRAAPLLDAIAIQNYELAKKISNKLAGKFNKGLEYKEDYDYIRVLTSTIQDEPNENVITKIMEDFFEATEGGDSIRYKLLKSIVESNENEFSEYFTVLIQNFEEETYRQRESSTINPYFDSTCAYIFVEGLAILQLSRKYGLPIENEYKYIPDVLIAENSGDFRW